MQSSRESVCCHVCCSGNMPKGEVEKENTSYPLIDCRVRLNVWIVEHAFQIFCVDFNCEVLDTNNVDVECAKCVEESVEFEFGL